MNEHCKFCGTQEGPFKLVAQGAWFDAEKINLCLEHVPLLTNTKLVELVSPWYHQDESMEFGFKPLPSIQLTILELTNIYLLMRAWILVKPKYPRRSPIDNIMLHLKNMLGNERLSVIHLGLLFIHWVVIEDECNLDIEEYDFYNPCNASLFDEMSMQEYQGEFGKCLHSIIKRETK